MHCLRRTTHWRSLRKRNANIRFTRKQHAQCVPKCHLEPSYFCELESETLERYQPGGYHPVNIDDTFKSGRYRVLQKLGWGGYSTVWLVYDSKESKLSAMKVVVSELGEKSNEGRILQHLSSVSKKHDGWRHLRKLTDQFTHSGPNGTHKCLIFGVDGVSVPMLVERCRSGRLPGSLAWRVSKQVTLALDYLHSNSIAHGDLYTANVLVSHRENCFSNPKILEDLPAAATEPISARPGCQMTKNLPSSIVEPASFHIHEMNEQMHATLIDFEQAFLATDQTLAEVRTPLVYRAPETVLDSTWDLKMDIWSLGCMIFDLVTGQPPFDNFMPRKPPLISEWTAMFGNVPAEWDDQARKIIGDYESQIPNSSLADWLHETYYHEDKEAEFAELHLELLSDLLSKMMRYRPEERLSTREILEHEWFAQNPLSSNIQ